MTDTRVRAELKQRLPWQAALIGRRVVNAVNPARRAREAARKEGFRRSATQLAPLRSTVHAGPFAGLTGLSRVNWGPIGPYLIGSYEEELHPHLERLLGKRPLLVVDVGASSGYYAVGAARRLPDARVIAVDTDPQALALCGRLAAANSVSERIRMKRNVTSRKLERWLSPRSLLIVDCEGCELGLLDPAKVPKLRIVDMIVELHDFVDTTISHTITSRFVDTHEVTVVPVVPRSPNVSRYPALKLLPPAIWADVLEEQRPPPPAPTMSWAILEPRPDLVSKTFDWR